LALDARDGRINPSGGLPPSTHWIGGEV
jgi:hypothetical protein